MGDIASGMVRLIGYDDLLVFDVPERWVALSSAAVGGGLVWPRFVVNVGVGAGFLRTDLDAYVAERLAPVGLAPGPVSALLTAADVSLWTLGEADGVRAWATVATTKPTWAAHPDARAVSSCHIRREGDGCDTREMHGGAAGPDDPVGHGAPPPPGTVNIVVAVPASLTTSALVQAVGTATEAKAQALLEAGVPGTGTASDALVVLCPDSAAAGEEPVPFAGVRSPWGHRIARAVHAAVAEGMHLSPWPYVAADESRVW